MSDFHILEYGSDERAPLVCLHDVRGHARRLERLARTLEDERHVMAYDLRGHGRSPWSGPHTIDQHVDDVDAVLDALGLDQAALLGEGFGGRIAIAYAAAHQERITMLTLLDPPLYPDLEPMLALARAERKNSGMTGLDDAIEQRRALEGLEHTPRFLLEEEMAEHLVADEDGRYRYRYSRAATVAAFEQMGEREAELPEVLCPVLLIHGDHSPLCGEADVARAMDELRRVRLETVPGGHVVLWDAFAETSAHVRSFVAARKIA